MAIGVSRRLFLSAAAAGVSRRFLVAQENEPDTTFSTSVSVVNVLATVRDSNGRIVSDLTKDISLSPRKAAHSRFSISLAKRNVRLALRSFAEHSALAQAGIDEKTERERNVRFAREILNRLWAAFLRDSEIVFRQIGNDPALAVPNGREDVYYADVCRKGSVALVFLRDQKSSRHSRGGR
jgi:hypothetical protein